MHLKQTSREHKEEGLSREIKANINMKVRKAALFQEDSRDALEMWCQSLARLWLSVQLFFLPGSRDVQ